MNWDLNFVHIKMQHTPNSHSRVIPSLTKVKSPFTFMSNFKVLFFAWQCRLKSSSWSVSPCPPRVDACPATTWPDPSCQTWRRHAAVSPPCCCPAPAWRCICSGAAVWSADPWLLHNGLGSDPSCPGIRVIKQSIVSKVFTFHWNKILKFYCNHSPIGKEASSLPSSYTIWRHVPVTLYGKENSHVKIF